MKQFIAEAWQRIKAHTPPFFKKIIAACATIIVACTALLVADNYLPKWLDAEYLKTTIAVCSGMALVCKLTVNWNKTSPNDVPDVVAPNAVELVKAVTGKPEDEQA